MLSSDWGVIDDMDMEKYFPGRFVRAVDEFDEGSMRKAERILHFGYFG